MRNVLFSCDGNMVTLSNITHENGYFKVTVVCLFPFSHVTEECRTLGNREDQSTVVRIMVDIERRRSCEALFNKFNFPWH